MTRIDLSPLYRSTIGFDRFASLLDSALNIEQPSNGFPPYNIEVTGENRYAITLAVAGFEENEIDIQVERGILVIRGRKATTDENREYLHQGIAFRTFERKFNLADHVEVVSAELKHGLLNLSLVKEIPESAKPRRIEINANNASTIEHTSEAAVDGESARVEGGSARNKAA